jgi:hypothetical protein
MNCLRTLERWDSWFESHSRRGCLYCVRLFCVCVVLCVGSGLATGWSPVQGVLSTMYRIKKPKKRPRSNKRTVDKTEGGRNTPVNMIQSSLYEYSDYAISAIQTCTMTSIPSRLGLSSDREVVHPNFPTEQKWKQRNETSTSHFALHSALLCILYTNLLIFLPTFLILKKKIGSWDHLVVCLCIPPSIIFVMRLMRSPCCVSPILLFGFQCGPCRIKGT